MANSWSFKKKMNNVLIKVDKSGGGIKDYTIFLKKLKKDFFELSLSIKKEKKGRVIIYQIGNSSRNLLLDFLINSDCIRVIELHDLLARNKILRKIYPIVLPFFLKKADAIILHSKHSKEMFHKIYGDSYMDKITIIPHAIFKIKASPIYKTNKKIKFLLIGQIKPSKGLYVILESFTSLSKKHLKKSELIIAGKIKDKLLNKIKNYNLNYVTIINKFLSEWELNNLINSSDFVFNFKIEDLGESSGIMARAIALNKPIISSMLGSNKEYFSESSLISKISKIDLQEKLRLSIDKKEDIIKKEKKLIEKIKIKLSKKNILEKYLRLVDTIKNE